MPKFDPSQFTAPKAKPLPVILLIDTSGSMSEVIDNTGVCDTGRTVFVDGKNYRIVTGGQSRMMVLNDCCRKMIKSFANNEQNEVDIELAILTFGTTVNIELPLTPASSIQWQDLGTGGDTPLGPALIKAKEMIEDRNIIPSRAYKPVIILISDGRPDAGWERPFEQFINEGRSSKCDRMAMGIGDDADTVMLSRFIAGTEHELFTASDPDRIKDFFRYATMSVTVRSRSQNPNEVPRSSDVKEQTQRKSNSVDDDDEDFF